MFQAMHERQITGLFQLFQAMHERKDRQITGLEVGPSKFEDHGFRRLRGRPYLELLVVRTSYEAMLQER